MPQTRLNAKPCLVWALICKISGAIQRAECHCTDGLNGMSEHVAALLYAVCDKVKEGLHQPGIGRQQTWHQPSGKISKSAFHQ